MNLGMLEAVLRLRDELSPALAAASRNVEAAGTKMKAAGAAVLPLSAALAAAGVGSIAMASKFEASITRMSSLAGVAEKDLARVRERIKELGPATGVGPQALADAMMKIMSTTTDVNAGLQILEMSAKGSAVGMGEAVDIAGSLTAILNSYGAAAPSAAAAMNMLTQAVKDGGAEAKELAPTLANVVPIAAQMGVSLDQVLANIATVTKLGVPAAEAVTQLTSVFSALLKETKQGSEALASVGLNYDKLRASIREKGLMESLIELEKRFGSNKTGLADVFGRIEALRNVMSSAGQQAGVYAQVLDNVRKSSDGVGATQTALNMAQKDAEMQWKQFTASVQGLTIELGTKLLPTFKTVLEASKPLIAAVASAVEAFGELPAPVQTTIIAVAAFVAALGPVLIATGSVVSAVGALAGVVGGGSALLVGLGMAGAAVAAFFATFKAVSWLLDAIPGLRKFTDGIVEMHLKLFGIRAMLDAHNAELAKGTNVMAGWTAEQRKAYDEHVKRVQALKDLAPAVAAVTAATTTATTTNETHAASVKRVVAELPVLRNDLNQLAVATLPTLRTGMTDLVPAAEKASEAISLVGVSTVRTKTMMEGLKGAFKTSLASLPQVILGALQGGGDVGKAIGAKLGGDVGTSLGESISAKFKDVKGLMGGLGKSLGSLAGPLGSMIGSLAGSALSKGISFISGLFKNKAKEALKAAKSEMDSFVQGQGGLDALKRKADEAGVSLAAMFAAKNKDQMLAAIEQVRNGLSTWEDAHKAVQEAMDRYGLTIEEMGA